MSILLFFLLITLVVIVLAVAIVRYRYRSFYNKYKKKILAVFVASSVTVGSMGAILYLEPPIGDEVQDAEAYIYEHFIPPVNSFGMGNTTFKTVNWSHFKQLLQDEIHVIATYKLNNVWYDGRQYLVFDKEWNDIGFWKLTPKVTIPVNIQGLNITFWCNKSAIDYFEKDDYEIWFNISANETETYSLMFNYSDLKDISGLTFEKGVYQDRFYLKITRGFTVAGHYEFDPTFGNTGSYFIATNCLHPNK